MRWLVVYRQHPGLGFKAFDRDLETGTIDDLMAGLARECGCSASDITSYYRLPDLDLDILEAMGRSLVSMP